MHFCCNICRCTHTSGEHTRGDGQKVLFCADCGMGVLANLPSSTSSFYEDGYYGRDTDSDLGYVDYTFTAEHGLLWAKLVVEIISGSSGTVLDVGCANGFLLGSLRGTYSRFGLEANDAAAMQASDVGVTIIGKDITDAKLADEFGNFFDVVTSIATFEHVLDFRGAVQNSLKLLKSHGVLLYEVPLISKYRDNSDWWNSSYEHIYYPTLSGLERLAGEFPDAHFVGFETDIKGYGSTYIGAFTYDADVFQRVNRVFEAMKGQGLHGLNVLETRANLAYHVVHCFRPSPDRVLALPQLLEVVATPNLLTRLTQLWHADCQRATEVEAAEARERWHEQQATNWRRAFEELKATMSTREE